MVATDKVFAGAVPALYDRLLVPLIFADYASDLAERAARCAPRDLLEVAAGTGVLTRALAALLDPAARIVASDLNQSMLDHAAARQADDGRIAWQTADALLLPFEDRRFDIVTCQFGAMFFPDKVTAYREAYRVLRPGGRYLFNVWDEIAANDFALVVTDALGALFPDDPPRFLARTPHGYHDREIIRVALATAEFASISIETEERTSRAASALEAATAFCQGTPLRNEIEARAPSGLAAATQAAADALARRFGDGIVEGRMRAHIVSAAR